MTFPEERRTPAPVPDDGFSPEYLAMLVVCGGSVRDSDWAALPESLASRRPRSDAASPPQDLPHR